MRELTVQASEIAQQIRTELADCELRLFGYDYKAARNEFDKWVSSVSSATDALCGFEFDTFGQGTDAPRVQQACLIEEWERFIKQAKTRLEDLRSTRQYLLHEALTTPGHPAVVCKERR